MASLAQDFKLRGVHVPGRSEPARQTTVLLQELCCGERRSTVANVPEEAWRQHGASQPSGSSWREGTGCYENCCCAAGQGCARQGSSSASSAGSSGSGDTAATAADRNDAGSASSSCHCDSARSAQNVEAKGASVRSARSLAVTCTGKKTVQPAKGAARPSTQFHAQCARARVDKELSAPVNIPTSTLNHRVAHATGRATLLHLDSRH